MCKAQQLDYLTLYIKIRFIVPRLFPFLHVQVLVDELSWCDGTKDTETVFYQYVMKNFTHKIKNNKETKRKIILEHPGTI